MESRTRPRECASTRYDYRPPASSPKHTYQDSSAYKALVEGPKVSLLPEPVDWGSLQQRAEENYAILATLKNRDEDGITRNKTVGIHIPHEVSDRYVADPRCTR
jgi:hypothetical protein